MSDYTYQLNNPAPSPWHHIIWYAAGVAVIILAAWLLKKYLDKRKRWGVFLQNQSVPHIVRNLILKEHDGGGFEIWVQQLFVSLGIPARVVGGQGDHGVDVVAEFQGKSIGIQCKRYSRGLVGEPALRDLYGSQRHGKFDMVMLITTGNFSYPALEWAQDKKDLKLINGNLLGKIILNRRLLLELLTA